MQPVHSDDELVEQVQQGDREAFGFLYQRYGARLRSLFASFDCRWDEAQDLTQVAARMLDPMAVIDR